MISRVYIYLAPTFEDEGVVDGHNWVELPGQVVAGVLAEILEGLGCKVDTIYSEGDKGWEFNFDYERVRMWARVGKIEDFLISLTVYGWLDLTGRRKRIFLQLLRRLDETLKHDPRFENIRWYTQKQMDAGDWYRSGKDGHHAAPS
jgi:hypothetical protein